MSADLDLQDGAPRTSVFSAPKVRARLRVSSSSPVAAYRDTLAWGKARLFSLFHEGVPADVLVRGRAELIDTVLREAWATHVAKAEGLSLLAVGGYGRGELLPASDIDILMLVPGALDAPTQTAIEQLLAFLWDIGLEVGASVRTVDECLAVARDDVTVITNLIESRHLAGNAALSGALQAALSDDQLWPAASFFFAKLEEQKRRHAKYDDTGYKLEPNVKESPGGLRDIHTVGWVAKRLYGVTSLQGLRERGFLSREEADELFAGQDFLWRVRFALHMLTKRHEDRLLFDHQRAVAALFGYAEAEGGKANAAVEEFMQLYYRTIKNLSCLNDILLQLIERKVLGDSESAGINPLNARFQVRGAVIEARDDKVFQSQPWALIEVFNLMAQHPDVEAIAAPTLRMMRRDLRHLNHAARTSLRARAEFMRLFHHGSGLTHALRRMNRYGVLGAYLPEFGRIVGLMQYDLFHTLTVDEHILYVVRNARRLTLPRFADELPFAHQVAQRLKKPELLYLGAFHHDMAKGRGGDHSTLGASEAQQFCLQHGLSHQDAESVAFLVENHLLMSLTAQKQDVHDPAVVARFAAAVKDRDTLDLLYLLTVSDIRGTNPKLWNSWRDRLLRDLYQSAARALERGLDAVPTRAERAERNRRHAEVLLPYEGVDASFAQAFWARQEEDYFLRHSPQELAWHAAVACNTAPDQLPCVVLRCFEAHGSTLFIYCQDRDHLFALTAAVLAQLGLNILDARLHTSTDGYVLDSYVLLDADGQSVNADHRAAEIVQRIARTLKDPSITAVDVTRRPNSRLKHFDTPTLVHIHQEPALDRTVVEVVAADRPGLLSQLGRLFQDHQLRLDAAKIATIGERAEDVFYLTTLDHRAVTDVSLLATLEERITTALA